VVGPSAYPCADAQVCPDGLERRTRVKGSVSVGAIAWLRFDWVGWRILVDVVWWVWYGAAVLDALTGAAPV